MKESVALLYEGLYELNELAEEAVRNKPFLYEGTGYTPMQIIIAEATPSKKSGKKSGKKPAKKPGKTADFLKRTEQAIEKVKKAAQAGVKELKNLSTALAATAPPMYNSSSAVDKAVTVLEKKIPGKGFLSKLGSLSGAMFNSLFGNEDDPIEEVTQIVADGLQFKTMMGNVVKSVLEILDQIEPTNVVDAAAEDAAADAGEGSAELTPEQKKKYIDELKQLLMNGSINDILTSDNEMYREVREVTGFSEQDLKAALKKSTKPAKWFSGLKSIGGALGIGLGGDLPFKKYGLKADGIIEDIRMVKISDLQSLSGAIQSSGDTTQIADELTGGVEAMSKLGAEKDSLQTQDTGGGETGEPSTGDPSADEGGTTPTQEPDTPGDDQPAATTKYVKILKSVPGLKDPDLAGEKLAALLTAGVSDDVMFSLRSLLVEKVLRYNDVVSALEDHLPDDEEAIPAAVKKLADEMKVELGNEFDIVGVPDSAGRGIEQLRDEIRSLRSLLGTLPDDVRTAAEQQISDELVSQGVDPEDADEVLTTDLDGEALVAAMQDGDINQVLSTLDDSAEQVEELVPEDALETPDIGDVYLYTVKTGKNKGKVIPVKIESIRPDDGIAVVLRPNKALDAFTKNTFAAKIPDLGEKTTEQEAFSAGVKEESRRIMVAKMRGRILIETNNLVFASSLSRMEVVNEYFRRGGTDEEILREMKEQPGAIFERWRILGGVK